MAFTNVGRFFLRSGGSFRFDGWTFPGGDGDRGAQYFSGHPINPNPDAKLVMDEQNKVLNTDGIFRYGFRITNEGPRDVFFSVQGGGFA